MKTAITIKITMKNGHVFRFETQGFSDKEIEYIKNFDTESKGFYLRYETEGVYIFFQKDFIKDIEI